MFCELSLSVGWSSLNEVTYRSIKPINDDSLKRDVREPAMCLMSVTTDIVAEVTLHDTTLSSTVDTHAPEKTRRIPARPLPR